MSYLNKLLISFLIIVHSLEFNYIKCKRNKFFENIYRDKMSLINFGKFIM